MAGVGIHGQLCTSKSPPSHSLPMVTPLHHQPPPLEALGIRHSLLRDFRTARDTPVPNPPLPGLNHGDRGNREACNNHEWVPFKPKDQCRKSEGTKRKHSESGRLEHDPACRALTMMGHSRSSVKKAAEWVISQGQKLNVENLIDAIDQQEGGGGGDDVTSESEDEDPDGQCSAEGATSSQLEFERDSTAGGDAPEDLYSQGGSDSAGLSMGAAPRETDSDSETHRRSPALEELLDENRRLKESSLCKICLDKNVQILFLPCRHLVCCRACADNIRLCPVCRQKIMGTVKTFIA